jgi:hypothetical protein
MQRDAMAEQWRNALSSICWSAEPDSNCKSESLSHDSKQHFEIISTEAGMQIDFNDQQREKAYSSMCLSLEPGSTRKTEIDEQEKHDFEIISTDAGRRID